jgi:hypothetical protein
MTIGRNSWATTPDRLSAHLARFALYLAIGEVVPDYSVFIRRMVLWVQARIDRNKVKIAGEPTAIEPGCCSNPELPQAVTERTLGPLGREASMGGGNGFDNAHKQVHDHSAVADLPELFLYEN